MLQTSMSAVTPVSPHTEISESAAKRGVLELQAVVPAHCPPATKKSDRQHMRSVSRMRHNDYAKVAYGCVSI